MAGATTVAGPVKVARHVSGDTGGTATPDLLHGLLGSLLRMLKASSPAAPYILSTAVTASSAAPSSAKVCFNKGKKKQREGENREGSRS